MLFEISKTLVLGLIGICLSAYLFAKFTTNMRCEWTFGSSIFRLSLFYGIWMFIGVFCSYLVIWNTSLIGTGLIALLLILLTIPIDKELDIQFYIYASLAEVVSVMIFCMVTGFAAFHLFNLLF